MDIFSIVNVYIDGFVTGFNKMLDNLVLQLKKSTSEKDLDKTIYVICQLDEFYSERVRNYRKLPMQTKETAKIIKDQQIFADKILSLTDDIATFGKESIYYPTIDNSQPDSVPIDTSPLIFLSHSSRDIKYGHALRDFICGLGIRDEQLIYTSHELHKIPLNEEIFDYLFNNISKNIFMILLWSDDYLESPACLCELGALRVTKANYMHVFTPSFDQSNPKYQRCPISRDKLGISLTSTHLKTNLLELKNFIESFLGLERTNEIKVSSLIDSFCKEIQDDV